MNPATNLKQVVEDRSVLEIHLCLMRAFSRGANPGDIQRAIDGVAMPHPHQLVAFHVGDGSVGLPGDSAVIQFDLSSYSAEDAEQFLVDACPILKPAFAKVFDNGATVVRIADER